MHYDKLKNLRKKLYFTAEDVADTLGIRHSSSLVVCSRYTKKGIFIRVKRNVYVLEDAWQNYSTVDFLKLSNFLQVPSYVSLTTALSFYEITTQVQQNYFENISLKRSAQYNVKGVHFKYCKMKKQYYFGYVRDKNIFMAAKEKAFLDLVYLYSFGKYRPDLDAIDIGKLDVNKIKKLSKLYPSKTRAMVEKLCGI